MAGVVAGGVAGDDGRPAREQVDDAPLSFISPLTTDHNSCWHVILSTLAGIWAIRHKIMPSQPSR
jgi:hypothetical protein